MLSELLLLLPQPIKDTDIAAISNAEMNALVFFICKLLLTA